MEKNIFKMAAEQKLRFPFRGLIAVEDLFDLSLTSLDTIYKELSKEVKKANEDSLLDVVTKEDDKLALRIEIVKTIFTQKQAEAKEKSEAKEKNEKRKVLLDMLAEKQNEELKGMTKEQILEELARI